MLGNHLVGFLMRRLIFNDARPSIKIHGLVHSSLGDVQSRRFGRSHMTVFAPWSAFSICLILYFTLRQAVFQSCEGAVSPSCLYANTTQVRHVYAETHLLVILSPPLYNYATSVNSDFCNFVDYFLCLYHAWMRAKEHNLGDSIIS